MVYTILVIVQVVVALSLIGLILIQHGKGADAGAAFGSGASGTVFGAKGSANFLTRATSALATLFFAISLTLAYLINGASAPTGSVTDQVKEAPGSSLLSDDNNNGVPGDEVLTGDKGAQPDSGDQGQAAPGDRGAKAQPGGSTPEQKQNGSAGSKAGDADTGAQVPD